MPFDGGNSAPGLPMALPSQLPPQCLSRGNQRDMSKSFSRQLDCSRDIDSGMLDSAHSQSPNFPPETSQLMPNSGFHRSPCSVHLIDDQENVLFPDAEALRLALDCPEDVPLKLIAIVGNTGDGKSYTLNQAFCHGVPVFRTSESQITCTVGIWAAYESKNNYLLVDTEGKYSSIFQILSIFGPF
ncbi:unnamed protein product [Protopolystoma xenopodis]|uniref:Guanylate-binding protein N-terminal domain-containing protein n=1 Tax=Protopolystoma xenopodis TaxID=117903 RepID=A0A448WSE6_9PLAT|nr:unnamed protein product [Protopolystoma xenopodis]